ncbi:hypothetical protein [Mycobacterium sp. 852002-40037_SCH5390672]|uniref:hypothetical protein n=1 Tax=Mycobacterium sp. 852002-40037_SCH5390672 TaxID=1834089 RepID=UPI001E45A702|nr:hypothetical protein [Mycobacterium sp. 852002-40037_SCH5390672]
MDATWVGSTASPIDGGCRRRWLRPPATTATTATTAIGTTHTAGCRIQVMLADRFRRLGIANIEPVCLRPAPGVTTNAFSIENLLRRSHHLVGRVPTGIRGVGVAARLNSLYLSQLLRR